MFIVCPRLTLGSDHPRQDGFIDAQNQNTSSEAYNRHLQHLRHVARDQGIEHVLKTYGVDVILGPTDSGLTSMATGGGERTLTEQPEDKEQVDANLLRRGRISTLRNAVVVLGLQWPAVFGFSHRRTGPG